MNKHKTDFNLISGILKVGEYSKATICMLLTGIIVSAVIEFIRPQIICRLTDEGLTNRDFHMVLNWCAVLFAVTMLAHMDTLLQVRLCADISNIFSQRLYSESLSSIMRAPYEFTRGRASSELVNSVWQDIEKTSLLLDVNMLTALFGVFQMFGGIAGLFVLNWQIALLIALVIPLKYIMITRFSVKRTDLTRDFLHRLQLFNEWFGNQISGVIEIKLWNLYNRKIKTFKEWYKDITILNTKMEMCDGTENVARGIVDQIIEILIYTCCGFMVCTDHMSLGNLLAIIAYSTTVSVPVDIMTNIPYMWARIKPSVERLSELLGWPREDLNSECSKNNNYDLTLKSVSYEYEDGKSVLKDISLNIPYGSKIAIVGENGSGKSTLVNIISGIIKPDTGSLHLGNQDIDSLGLKNWRECFAVASQNFCLFKGTVGENISMELKSDRISINDLILDAGIECMTTYDSDYYTRIILENGKDLSGGERQKIALIRALVKDAEILILDESLSNCDEESRAIIRNTVLSPAFRKTVIIISHYQEDIEGVQQIYELKDGRIWECKL